MLYLYSEQGYLFMKRPVRQRMSPARAAWWFGQMYRVIEQGLVCEDINPVSHHRGQRSGKNDRQMTLELKAS